MTAVFGHSVDAQRLGAVVGMARRNEGFDCGADNDASGENTDDRYNDYSHVTSLSGSPKTGYFRNAATTGQTLVHSVVAPGGNWGSRANSLRDEVAS